MFHFYTPWKHQKTVGFQRVYKWNLGWKWVKDRYGNRQVLISAYMKNFIAKNKNDDIKELRNLYDKIESSLRNL